MKNIYAILLVIFVGCSSPGEPITESEVIDTVEGLFEALDVEKGNRKLLDQHLSKDFMIYEDGVKMDRREFIEFASEVPIIETNWELSDFRISIDEHSAHVSLLNQGTFIVQPDSVRMRYRIKWLESAHLVRESDSLKIRFYFSDNISRESDTIQ